MLYSDESIHPHQACYFLNIYSILYVGLFLWLSDSLSTWVIGFPFLCICSNSLSSSPPVVSHTWTLHIIRMHVVNARLGLPLDFVEGASDRSYISCRRFRLLRNLSCAELLFILLHRRDLWILHRPLHLRRIHWVKQCILLHSCTVLLLCTQI